MFSWLRKKEKIHNSGKEEVLEEFLERMFHESVLVELESIETFVSGGGSFLSA